MALILTIAALLLAGCARKKTWTINIQIKNGGARSDILGNKVTDERAKTLPVDVTITLSDREGKERKLAEKIKVKQGEPYVMKIEEPGGDYGLRVEELNTGASKQTMFSLNHDYWINATFYREGTGMGFFELKGNTLSWDSDGWKSKTEAQGDVMKEEEVNRKLEDLRVETSRKRAEKKMGAEKKEP